MALNRIDTTNETVSNKIIWLLDSGCSDHIVNDIKYLSKYIELTKNVNIKVGDGHLIKALGIGTIVMKCKVDNEFTTVTVRNCYYAPNMSQNLLSVSKITDLGNKLWTEREYCEIFNHNDKIIAIALKDKNLYKLTGQVVSENVKSFSSNLFSLKEKWHRILGHVNFKDLNVICKDQLVEGTKEYRKYLFKMRNLLYLKNE